MPSSASTATLVFAAILATLSPVAAVVLAGIVALFEVYLFVRAGLVP